MRRYMCKLYFGFLLLLVLICSFIHYILLFGILLLVKCKLVSKIIASLYIFVKFICSFIDFIFFVFVLSQMLFSFVCLFVWFFGNVCCILFVLVYCCCRRNVEIRRLNTIWYVLCTHTPTHSEIKDILKILLSFVVVVVVWNATFKLIGTYWSLLELYRREKSMCMCVFYTFKKIDFKTFCVMCI